MGTLSNMVYYAAFKQERGGSYREKVSVFKVHPEVNLSDFHKKLAQPKFECSSTSVYLDIGFSIFIHFSKILE